MKVTDLQPKCKIKNKLGYELIVDKIIGDEIYTSGWNLPLTKFDRLRWTIKQVEEQIDKLGRVLLDGKIRLTKDELKKLVSKHIGNYSIIEFLDKNTKDDKLIIDKQLTAGDIIFAEGVPFEFLEYIDGKTLLSLETSGQKIKIIVEDEHLKHYAFSKECNVISLQDAILKIYNEDASLVILTD